MKFHGPFPNATSWHVVPVLGVPAPSWSLLGAFRLSRNLHVCPCPIQNLLAMNEWLATKTTKKTFSFDLSEQIPQEQASRRRKLHIYHTLYNYLVAARLWQVFLYMPYHPKSSSIQIVRWLVDHTLNRLGFDVKFCLHQAETYQAVPKSVVCTGFWDIPSIHNGFFCYYHCLTRYVTVRMSFLPHISVCIVLIRVCFVTLQKRKTVSWYCCASTIVVINAWVKETHYDGA